MPCSVAGAGRQATPAPTPSTTPPAPAPPAPPPVGVRGGGDTLLPAAPPDEAFALLLEAGHRAGNVSYVDRARAIFEVVVRDDETCSLVVTLQAGPTGQRRSSPSRPWSGRRACRPTAVARAVAAPP